jgi:hypothetical protein
MSLRVRPDASNAVLTALLRGHPGVEVEPGATAGATLEWEQNGRARRIGGGPAEVSGLVETIDNNPLVCADSYLLPSPAETLSLIASAPLERSGLLAATLNGEEGLTESGFVLEGRFRLAIVPDATEQDVAEAYTEAFGRSLYVRLADDDPTGRPWASLTYALQGREVTARVRADRHGKVGAAQAVHVFNVMAGFPESEGITDRLPR